MDRAGCLPAYSSILRGFGLMVVYLSVCLSIRIREIGFSHQSLSPLPTIRQLELVLFYF